MHRRSTVLSFASAATTLASALAILRFTPASTALARRADPTATPPSVTTSRGCWVEATRDVGAARIALTDTVAVTLTVRGCQPEYSPVNVVFVVDADVSRTEAVRNVRAAATSVLDELRLPDDPDHQVAVVGFGTIARVLVPLTRVRSRILAGITRAQRSPGDAVDAGIKEATKILLNARRATSRPNAIREVMVIFSPAVWERGACGRANAATGAAKGQGILVVAAMAGRSRDGDLSCFRSMATSPRYFFELDIMPFVGRIFRTIRRAAATTLPIRVVITDTVSPAYDVEPATVDPPAHAISADGRTLHWQLPATITWPAAATSVTYRVRPTTLGLWPVSLGAIAVVTDVYAARATIDFPGASIEVVDPASADARVCPAARSDVPIDVIAAALAHPERVAGWGLRCSASQPPGPANPLRRSLRLSRPGMAYHPVANGVVWACGCR